MVRLADLPQGEAKVLREWQCPAFDSTPFITGPPLAGRKVAVISTAGLRRRTDTPFAVDSVDYRVIPTERRDEVVQDHVNASHDRTAYAEDLNVVFPVDRLLEMAAAGEIGAVADHHYSFMGATGPVPWEPFARRLAPVMQSEGVDAVLLAPV